MVDNWVSGKRLQEISGKPGEAGKRLRVINAGAGRVVSSNRKAAPCGAASPECNQLFHVGIMLHAVVGGLAQLRDRFLIVVMRDYLGTVILRQILVRTGHGVG